MSELDEQEFIEQVEFDLQAFDQSCKENKILLFPNLSNYYRYLIHNIVQEKYSQFKTLSIEVDDNRRLCVYLPILVETNKAYRTQFLKMSKDNDELEWRRKPDDNASQTTNQANKSPTTSKSGKARREPQQIYVPKQRRQQQQVNTKAESDDCVLRDPSIIGYIGSTTLNTSEMSNKSPDKDDASIVEAKLQQQPLSDDKVENLLSKLKITEEDKKNENIENIDRIVVSVGQRKTPPLDPSSTNTQPGDDSWDNLYSESGECLDKKVIKQLNASLGINETTNLNVQEPKTIDYLKFSPKEIDLTDEEFPHVIEIYDFAESIKTENIYSIFKECLGNANFNLKWVDDTHCLGIFTNTNAAQSALQINHVLLKTRPVSKATQESKKKAKTCFEQLKPFKERPQTSSLVANQMIGSVLGIRVSKEKQAQEKNKVANAREKIAKEKQLKDSIWEGNT